MRAQFTTGIVQDSTGTHIDHFKRSPWLELHGILDQKATAVLMDLLLDHSVFFKIGIGKNNYQQMSGGPIHELTRTMTPVSQKTRITAQLPALSRQLGNIKLARHRTLYAMPEVRKSGQVRFGLGYSHALNRYSTRDCHEHDIVLLKYLFPRQFRLHNVFDDRHRVGNSKQATKDYTYRETEIRLSSRKSIPRRLRGQIVKMVQRIRRNHSTTQYAQLLAHYCHIPVVTGLESGVRALAEDGHTIFRSQHDRGDTVHAGEASAPTVSEDESVDTSLLPFVTPASSVAAFCIAALGQILPRDALGRGPAGANNVGVVQRHIYEFVTARKTESTTMHELVQGLNLKSISWLTCPHLKPDQRLSRSDQFKRQELMSEFIFYLFDSLLVPLIATNFYVTESGVHKNKLLYFRHDVWRRLSRPHIDMLTSTTLSPIARADVSTATSSSLGLGSVRLVPKEKGCRPITNLQQSSIKSVNGRRVVHASVNTRLQSLFNIFNYERGPDHAIFHVHSFSWRHIHQKLTAFRSRVRQSGRQRLYFVKTDIQSAFQSIPQPRLLEVVKPIFRHEAYSNHTRVEGKLGTTLGDSMARPQYVYRRFAKAARGPSQMADMEWTSLPPVHDSVYLDLGRRQDTTAQEARETLDRHVRDSLVRIDGQVCRQVEGIPQGSKISSLLCTFFYNHFERHRLPFLNEDESLLLRVVDDFLLITTNPRQAEGFLHALTDGDGEYGITMHLDKCLVNFDTVVHDTQVPKLSITRWFPFCGLLIDTQSLQISKDRMAKDNTVSNALTVDRHGRAAAVFHRRTLGALKNQLLPILLDRDVNDADQVVRSLVQCLQVTSMKMHQHFVNLARDKRPSPAIVIAVVKSMIALADRAVNRAHSHPHRHWSHGHVSCIASMAIASVLARKNTHYQGVLTWLQAFQRRSPPLAQAKVVVRIVQDEFRALAHLKY